MKKVIIAITLMFLFGHIANAQIKVVGDDYSTSLSAAKSYYEQDVDFEKIFPKAKLGEQYNSIGMTLDKTINHIGDTVWCYTKDTNCERYDYSTRMTSCSCGFGVINNYTIWGAPVGYYVISGYVIGRENVAALFSRCYQDTSKLFYGYAYNGFRYTTDLGEMPGIKQLKEDILVAKLKKLPEKYIAFVKLTSIEPHYGTRLEYYAPCLSHYFNVNFYNEIRKHFLNQKIILLYGSQIEFVSQYPKFYNVTDTGRIWSDAITREKLKLADRVFTVEDVVVKLEKERGDITTPHLYVIVRGENTGSFAIQPKSIDYMYYVSKFDYIRNGSRHPNYSNYEYPYLKLETYSYYDEYTCITKNDYLNIWQQVSDSVDKINKEAEQKNVNEENQRLANQRKKELEEKQRKEAFLNSMIAKYGSENGQLVGNKRIAIGMTKEMCKDAWGMPMDSYRTTTKYGQSDVWCYNYKTRVYFFDGKVVKIDN